MTGIPGYSTIRNRKVVGRSDMVFFAGNSKLVRPIAAACLALVTAAAADTETVRYEGPIEAHQVDSIIRRLDESHARQLEIASFGGSEAAGLRLGIFLRSRRITVIVRRVCLSACAQYVLLPSHSAVIGEHALIGFHSSSYALNRWSARANQHRIAAASRELAELSARTLSRAQLELLARAFSAIGPSCLAEAADRGSSPKVKTVANFWVPSKEILRAVHLQPPDSWPDTTAQASEVARKYVRGDTVIAFGNGSPPWTRPLEKCTHE